MTAESSVDPAPERPVLSVRFWLLLALVVAVGTAARVYPSGTYTTVGFDAELYRNYVVQIETQGGVGRYPEICKDYLKRQKAEKLALLPPTRFLYIFCGYVWKRAVYGDAPPLTDLKSPGALWTDPVMRSFRGVSITFSVLLFLLVGVAAWRMFGPHPACAVMALFACAPLQLHMSQNVLIDGFVAFWATLSLWLLWETLQHPRHWGWLAGFTLSLVALVLVKENAAFVFIGLGGVLVLNRWARFGTATAGQWVAILIGPLLGVFTLMRLAGGWKTLTRTYELLVAKASAMPYAIATGDGPWHRYLVEMLLVSPFVFCLALAAIFYRLREHRAAALLFTFMAFSYVLMCNVRYGMNLRYTTIWDFPVRTLAWAQLAWIVQRFGARQELILGASVALLCLYDLRQFYTISVAGHAQELVPRILLRAFQILKPGS